MAGNYPVEIDMRGEIDAIFVWGRAVNEWQSYAGNGGVIDLAAWLHRNHRDHPPIIIPGYVGSEKGQGETGYPGHKIWSSALQRLGVPADKIMPTVGHGYNTKTEMDDCLDIAKKFHWKKIIGITLQTHALRAMLGTVKSLESRKVQLKVFPYWPTTFDHTQQVFGSQGKGPLPRSSWIEEEYNRIPRYMAQGDLCTLEELLTYLKYLVV